MGNASLVEEVELSKDDAAVSKGSKGGGAYLGVVLPVGVLGLSKGSGDSAQTSLVIESVCEVSSGIFDASMKEGARSKASLFVGVED